MNAHPPATMSPFASLQMAEDVFGGYSSSMPAESVLKPAGIALLDEPVVRYLQKLEGRSKIVDRAWIVMPKRSTVPMDLAAQHAFAERLGKKLFSALIAKGKVHYSVPHLHDHRLYVLMPHHAHVVQSPSVGRSGGARATGRAAGKLYEYVLLRRPFGFGATPSGFVGHRASVDPKKYPHGVVQYEKPLMPSAIESFELLPLDPLDIVNIRRVRDAWRDYVRDRFANHEMVNVDDDDIDGFRVLTYSTRPGVEYQVTTFQRMGPVRFGLKRRAEPTGHLDFNDFDRAADALSSKKTREHLKEAEIPRA